MDDVAPSPGASLTLPRTLEYTISKSDYCAGLRRFSRPFQYTIAWNLLVTASLVWVAMLAWTNIRSVAIAFIALSLVWMLGSVVLWHWIPTTAYRDGQFAHGMRATITRTSLEFASGDTRRELQIRSMRVVRYGAFWLVGVGGWHAPDVIPASELTSQEIDTLKKMAIGDPSHVADGASVVPLGYAARQWVALQLMLRHPVHQLVPCFMGITLILGVVMMPFSDPVSRLFFMLAAYTVVMVIILVIVIPRYPILVGMMFAGQPIKVDATGITAFEKRRVEHCPWTMFNRAWLSPQETMTVSTRGGGSATISVPADPASRNQLLGWVDSAGISRRG